MIIPVKLSKEEYKYLLEILKDAEDTNKVDYNQDIDKVGAAERLQMP